MLTNLKNLAFPERFTITDGIRGLLERTNDSAYQLSMQLLISAQLGNEELYQRALLKIEAAMQNEIFSDISQNSFKAWLYGRILLAAHSINDAVTITKTLRELKAVLQDKNTLSDRFSAWSWGYIASLNIMEYNDAKLTMKNAADKLTAAYVEINKGSYSDNKKQEFRSDALWAWVMSLQAAANADDKEVYNYSLEQIQLIAEQPSVSDSLLKGLLRTSTSNDYPAWAIAITRLAAVTIGDEKIFMELEAPLIKSIEEAKYAQAKPELLLAQVNSQLVIARQKILSPCFNSTSVLYKS